MSVPKEWWEDFFSGIALDFWRLAMSEEWTWSRWADVLIVVKPETVVSWHRAGFRLYWRFLSRRGPALNELTKFGGNSQPTRQQTRWRGFCQDGRAR